MNETTLPYATRTPLISPAPTPTPSATSTMTIQCESSAMVCVAIVDAHTEASPSTEPTDRSMPPPVMTNVMPIDSTPSTEARRRIVRRLSSVANRSPAVMIPTRQIATSAITSPRLRPAGPCSRLRRRRGGDPGADATVPGAGASLAATSCSLMRHFLP